MEDLQFISELVSIAAGLAVIVGVGWGLRLARQVVQTKDATIQKQQAHIDHLERLQSAPLALALEAVTKTVNKYVGKSQELERQLEESKKERKTVAGVAFMEAYLAIEDLRRAYQSASGGFDALALPSKMHSVAEEFFIQGERAFAGQEIEVPRVKQAIAGLKS